MNDLKQIRILSLKCVIIAFFVYRIQRSFVKPQLMHPLGFKACSTDYKWGIYGAGTGEGSRANISIGECSLNVREIWYPLMKLGIISSQDLHDFILTSWLYLMKYVVAMKAHIKQIQKWGWNSCVFFSGELRQNFTLSWGGATITTGV